MTQEKTSDYTVTPKVVDVMNTEIITTDENASVREDAEIMNLNELSSLIAARNGKAVGVITERDLLKRLIVEAKSAKKQWSPKSCQPRWMSSHPTRTWKMQ